MKEKKFEYGPLARGIYRGMISVTLLMPLAIGPINTLIYAGFLLFLGVGLRPLLERTGLHDAISYSRLIIHDKANQGFVEKRRAEVARKVRDEKYRNRRFKDPKLPPNW